MNRGTPTQISLKLDPTIYKTTDDKQEFLKVYIMNNMGDINSNIVSLYIPIFNTGLAEALLKFLVLLYKILQGQIMTTIPQIYATTNNLL